MKVTIYPSSLKGPIQAPASKSSMQRACAAALLRKGKTVIQNPGHSNDDKAALQIMQDLGATVTEDNGDYIVQGNGVSPVAEEIFCGESGLSIRMFTPLAALASSRIIVTGEGSLVNRPMHFFDLVFPQLGVEIQSNENKLPLQIRGPLQPQDIRVDGSLSSQFLTGLLLAYASASESEVEGKPNITISVDSLTSKPYIDLTLDVMGRFGLQVPVNNDYREFTFKTGHPQQHQEQVVYTVEGDWSGASFLLVAGAIAGPLTVRGLDLASTQADRRILDALMSANAGIATDAKGIHLVPGGLKGFYFDATDCPDLFPPLVALAAYCAGVTTIKGVSRLEHKESNRALTLQEEFDKMGVDIELEGDIMTITPGRQVKGADVESHHDHRIAMACAIAGLKADSEMVIDDAEAVAKSYPDFYRDLGQMGVKLDSDTKIKLI
ncbi:MAG: 3-phosphoshikimate 1-carboxyvinyltransferase [Chitinophagaceae bacterium]|nr:MAG: 3-phosphoshikimate 1-carboxyvinyltransferase [Chitinophagaceae bacterium]